MSGDGFIHHSPLTTHYFYQLAKEKLEYDLKYTRLFSYCTLNGVNYPVGGRILIEHPLPSVDEGVRRVGCINDLSHKNPAELAELLIKVNSHSTDAFFNQIRRRLSILERPLVTARGDGKSYIYSNYNPKYAEYSVTILTTIYNFCWTFKSKGEIVSTPAQRLGLADKVYDYKDIL